MTDRLDYDSAQIGRECDCGRRVSRPESCARRLAAQTGTRVRCPLETYHGPQVRPRMVQPDSHEGGSE